MEIILLVIGLVAGGPGAWFVEPFMAHWGKYGI
jgi:hypothetical protein